jgi:hypothetical protein
VRNQSPSTWDWDTLVNFLGSSLQQILVDYAEVHGCWVPSRFFVRSSGRWLPWSNTIYVLADAYVGSWIAVQERTAIAARHTTHSHASPSLLLLCARMSQQHRTPQIQATEGLPHSANTLQTEARNQALHVRQM